MMEATHLRNGDRPARFEEIGYREAGPRQPVPPVESRPATKDQGARESSSTPRWYAFRDVPEKAGGDPGKAQQEKPDRGKEGT
jgi:hypothetical protein